MPTWLACVARVRADCSIALLWGLGMALHEGSEFINGQPKDTKLDTYGVLRMADVPEIEVEFLPSTEAPVGLGEPATTWRCTGDRKCDLRRLRGVPPPPADPARSRVGSARASGMTMAAAE